MASAFLARWCFASGFGAGGPLEGLWVLVSMLDPLVNRGLEFDDVVEGSSSDALASDFGEEPLDEVEPGTGCRREVQCEAFVSRQPALHDRHDAMTVRRHQHDPRSLGDLLSRVSIGEQLLQFPASLAIKCNQVVSHAASESGSRQVGIQMSVTEH